MGLSELCPNSLVHAHLRFAGEVISVGEVTEPDLENPRVEAVAEDQSKVFTRCEVSLCDTVIE